MFSKIFIERPRLAMVVSLVMILAGVLCIGKLPVAEYPQITPPQVSIDASYTGASAEVIANTVAIPIESQINGVDNILYYSSTCSNSGAYSCTVTFKSGTDPDMNMVNVQNAVKLAEAELPDDVTKVGLTIRKRTSDILAMIVFRTDKSKLSLIELDNYIQTSVKDAIERTDGVSSASIWSAQEYSMRIWLDPIRMSGLGISVSDIASAVESQNLQAAAGTIGGERSSPYMSYKINVQGRLATTKEFGDIIVRNDSDDGSIIHLSDIARIELGASSYSGSSAYNGEQCVGMAIYRNSEANALATMGRVEEVLKDYQTRFPEGVSYKVAYDPTEFIEVSLKEIISTLIIAVILVVAITFLFLQDWRATLIPACAIPVALLATFPIMLAIGYSINILTMFGLILVIGSLVDDAIVVVENAQALMEREGLSAKKAAIKSMQQITGAVVATTMVTVACYAPLAFYGGMVGEIYMQFSVTMCIALIFSTVVALTLSPALCSLLLRKPSENKHAVFKPVNFVLDHGKNVYIKGVRLLVRKSLLTIIIFACVIGGIYGVSKLIPSSFLPAEDKGAIFCNIELPEGAAIARTEKVLEQLQQKLKDIHGVESYLTVAGFSMMNGQGENVGMAILHLIDWDERTTPALQIDALVGQISGVLSQIPDAKILCFTPPAMMGLGMSGGSSFMLSGTGDIDPVALSNLAKKTAMEITMMPVVHNRLLLPSL